MPSRRSGSSRVPVRKLPLILVTGFDPFGKEKMNPSEWVVRKLRDDEISGVKLLRVILPTEFRKAEMAVLDLLRKYRPDGALALGLASQRAGVALEALALNLDHSEIADNAGEYRTHRKIEPRGPWVLEGSLPLPRLIRALSRSGIPASVSYHAGTYVCNHVFYVMMHALGRRPRIPAGFVHLPPLRRLLGRGFTEEKMELAVRSLLGALAREIAARR